MKSTIRLFYLLLSLSCFLVCSQPTQALSTFGDIYNIFQTNCTGACHTSASPDGGLNFTASQNNVYNQLIDATPVNAVAAAKDDKLVDPGYPYRSYLLRKINNDPSELECLLEAGEGDIMPPAPDPALSNIDMERIRQWIYFGAPQNGNVVDMGMIEDYYLDGGVSTPRFPAPDPSEGFQIRLGPIFVDSFDELEYAVKYDTRLPVNTEINRIETTMSNFSHHFIMYKFVTASAANSLPEGLRNVANFDNPLIVGGNEIVAVWQFSDNIDLPDYTAYYWDANTELDLNYHVPNYSGLGVLAADAYINIYTQPEGTALGEMKSKLLLKPTIFIPNNSQNDVETEHEINNEQWNIWMMTSHTHKYGVDFDVFLRTPGGQIGSQIYEGSPFGFYDWAHPHIEYFEPFLELAPFAGLVQQATFNNYGPSPVFFGVTTDDEMMITIIQYTEGDPIQVPTTVLVKGKVWLEGPYDQATNLMENTLQDNDLIPLNQPFDRPPWSYIGTENVATLGDIPANTIDWILVEVRDEADNNIILEQRAGFLRNDGIIMDIDGNEGLHFSSITSGSDYYLSVKTRNHLAVLSTNSLQLPNTTTYDFTLPANVSGGTDQLAALNGTYGMVAGDFDSNGTITVADFNLYTTQASLINEYVDGDCNLDKSVTIADFNLYQSNTSIIGVSQIRY